jgi:hypothetical protein
MKHFKNYSIKNPDLENIGLLKYRKNVTSQLGEDGIIEQIFKLIPSSNEFCVEFGAGNGFTLSNTFNLIKNFDWTGVLIEANKTRHEELVERYSDNENVYCIKEKVSFEGENTLDNILSDCMAPTDFELLSIDVDGNDYHIWNSLLEFKPKVVVIEFNPTIPNHVSFVQERNINVFQGSSLRAITELAKLKGYELICATEWNAFYVLKEYFSLFGIKDNSIDRLYNFVKYQTNIFQLYDGTIVLNGHKSLLWNGTAFDDEKMQVLPKEKRIFSNVQ